MRILPIVKIGRTEFYIDERLSQIRAVNNPYLFEDISPEVIAYLLTQADTKQKGVKYGEEKGVDKRA